MNTSAYPPVLDGLHRIAKDYDALICDVWGVVHNGRDPFPEAVEALHAFRAARGPVVLLSNSPRLISGVQRQFDHIGVPQDCYDAMVTSGEATREDLTARSADKTLSLYYIGPERDRPIFDGLNIRLSGMAEAELVVCTGPWNDDTETPEDYRALLESFREAAICLAHAQIPTSSCSGAAI